jgi:hypothetical protein
MQAPDYRDRVSIYLWVILAMLAAELFLQLPTRTLTWIIFGTPLSVEMNSSTLLAVPLLVLAASGVEAVVRAHPLAQAGELPNTWILWSLPCALVLTAAQLLPLISGRITWLAVLALIGALLAAISIIIYHTIDERDRYYRLSRIALNFITYAVVLLLFLIVYQSRARSVLSGTVTAAIGALLTIELLRGAESAARSATLRQVLTYGLLCGLVLGEATWALNYWQLPSLTAGFLMLLMFYLLVGLAQQGIAGAWRRIVVLEFLAIGAVGCLLIWQFALR